MTIPLLRTARREDLALVEALASQPASIPNAPVRARIRWGDMPRLTKALLEERWSQPAVARELTQTAKHDDQIVGYSDVYVVSRTRATFHGLASATPAARALIQWACGEADKRDTVLQTGLFAVEAGERSAGVVADQRRIDCSPRQALASSPPPDGCGFALTTSRHRRYPPLTGWRSSTPRVCLPSWRPTTAWFKVRDESLDMTRPTLRVTRHHIPA